MKFWCNTNFTLPKQTQRSRSVFQVGSRSLGLFWKENNPSYNRRNTVVYIKFRQDEDCSKSCPETKMFTDGWTDGCRVV